MDYLAIEERVNIYNQTFTRYPSLTSDNGWIIGMWYCSRLWKRQEFYGQYPLTYLKRIYAMFPDCKQKLHLFSGTVKSLLGETTFDSNSSLSPDVVGKVQNIKQYFDSGQFDLVIADPPYEDKDFKVYGYEPFSKRQALRDIYTVCKGYLIWLDLMIPSYSKDFWKLIGTIGILTGTNSRVRVTSIFEKVEGG